MADLVFTQVECGKMSRIFQALGHSFHGWEISQGAIDGKINVRRTENHRPHVWGDALLTGLALRNNVLGMNVEVPKANAKLETQKDEKGLLRVVGRIGLDDQAFVRLLKKGVPYWEMDNLKGEVLFVQVKKYAWVSGRSAIIKITILVFLSMDRAMCLMRPRLRSI